MAHLMRGKQAGVQNDFSGSISPEFFAIDDVGSVPFPTSVQPLSGAQFRKPNLHSPATQENSGLDGLVFANKIFLTASSFWRIFENY